ncbi:hypothetical protein NLX83_22035 [Allokutzneria sp. A3M-2-11 16]|uniref:DUF6545 domain-containing protein n=1 Tax=Allokutzneria sp. A3M-2-11 16 TaxID=2962043 RepID=UPI0020B63933|nr:DUF6545 domain-containing protein [Allokutzneria sp. A3M-2-11 16]MCP3801951.1 hypothetical protein [Allokutzneria sp. A3M-2-11 16]
MRGKIDLDTLDVLTEGLSPVTGVEALLLASGVWVPSAGWWLRLRYSWWVLWRLWRDVLAEAPELALREPRARLLDVVFVRDVSERVCRAVVEIRDVMLVLRPYVTAEDHRATCDRMSLELSETPGSELTFFTRVARAWRPGRPAMNMVTGRV